MSQVETEEHLHVLRQQKTRLEDTGRWVARALCDQTLQHVVLVQLELARIEQNLRRTGEASFAKTRELLDQIVLQLNTFSSELHPKVLEDLGLVPAIEVLTQRFSKTAGIPIRIDSTVRKSVPPIVGTILHEIVFEALTNVVHHSRATNVCIRLAEQAGQFICIVLDDGIGFDVSEVLEAKGDRGAGLISIRASARLSGGNVTIRSEPGHGTELLITLPGVTVGA